MSLHDDKPVELVAQYLLFKFYYCLDTRDYHGAAALFHPDGVWVRQGEQLLGPPAILAALALRSATLVIQLSSFSSGELLTLRGPGIDGRREFSTCGLPPRFWASGEHTNSLFRA